MTLLLWVILCRSPAVVYLHSKNRLYYNIYIYFNDIVYYFSMPFVVQVTYSYFEQRLIERPNLSIELSNNSRSPQTSGIL